MSCALPYGNLFLCPQCYETPKSVQTTQETKESPKPPLESILGLFGGIIILVGFFMPWVTSDFTSPSGEHYDDTVISGFIIARDYAEVSVVFIMGILTIITELLLMALITSPMMVKEPPIGVRLLPMFLGFVAYVILAEIVLRAESFTANIHIGWFACVFGASVVLLAGVIEIWKYYKGT